MILSIGQATLCIIIYYAIFVISSYIQYKKDKKENIKTSNDIHDYMIGGIVLGTIILVTIGTIIFIILTWSTY